MICLDQRGPNALILCTNGHTFEVDACVEENLVFDGDELLAKCPECGEVDAKPSETSTRGVRLSSPVPV